MRHPGIGRWTDFVRGLSSPEDAVLLERHLAGRCDRCSSRVETLTRMVRVAASDRRFVVPAAAVRFTHHLFRVHTLRRKADAPRVVPSLAFDSLSAPAALGVRSGLEDARHLMYESPDLVLDLFLSSDEAERELRVGGQLFDGATRPLVDVPVFLLQSGEVASQAVSDQEGDFGLAGSSARSARLFLLLDDRTLADVELPGPPEA